MRFCLLPWVAILGLLACGSREPRPSQELVIFAASSLTDVFETLASAFEKENPGVHVALTFAGSQVMRFQIENGASADVFASADERHMQALADASLVSQSESFGANQLVVIVPKNNPAGISEFSDLHRAQRVVVGVDSAPIGHYTRELFARARAILGPAYVDQVESHIVSKESNVRLVRAKVELGEADAAIVYGTDAIRSSLITRIAVPESMKVSARYFIGTLTSSKAPELARRWLDFLQSKHGRKILASFAIEVPS